MLRPVCAGYAFVSRTPVLKKYPLASASMQQLISVWQLAPQLEQYLRFVTYGPLRY